MSDLLIRLDQIAGEGLAQIERSESLVALEQVRIGILGRQGTLTRELRSLSDLPDDERPKIGARANEVRRRLEQTLIEKERSLKQAEVGRLAAQPIDLTTPGIRLNRGHRHPVSIILDEMVQQFWQMGYQVAEGPEIETDWYNFEALLLGLDHPARDAQDTFYLEKGNFPPYSHVRSADSLYGVT